MSRHATANIPHFALYGESVFTHKPEFVHIERIRERSERNGWLIKPHRHSHLFQLLFIHSGSAEVQLDSLHERHKGCGLISVPAGTVHGFNFEPGTDGVVLSVAIDMPGLNTDGQLGILLEATLSQPAIIRLSRRTAQYRELLGYIEGVDRELAVPQQDQQVALYSLVKLILVLLRRQLQQERSQEQLQAGNLQLVNRFRILVEQNYKQHWQIGRYADALHVSISTLNRACQEVLGCATKKLIQQRLHVEAQRRLIYTQETLDQISWDLGYKDAPYFSRVFKQLEGKSPKAFRRQKSQPRRQLS